LSVVVSTVLDMTEIRTERLLLRRVDPDDLPVVVEIQGDPATSRYRAKGPTTPDESATMLATWLVDWATHGIGYWAVHEQESGAVVGIGGVRLHVLDGQQALNLYYRFRPAVWGRGYATEMTTATVSWAKRVRPELPVVIVTRENNKEAVRVAEKAGFVLAGTTAMYGGVSLVFRQPQQPSQVRASGVGTSGATAPTTASST
jgi:RimJ/RimL family protein N-acetyltransferase